MASSGELRIGRGWIGAAATMAIAVGTIGAAHAAQSASRIGSLERQGSVNRSKIEGIEKRLDYMTSILEKLRDRPQ